jgi:hypothetical protein
MPTDGGGDVVDKELDSTRKNRSRRKFQASIKRTPWKVDVNDRLLRVTEDIEVALRANGWKMSGGPDWLSADDNPGDKQEPGGPVALEAVDGGQATPQMRQAEAVVSATVAYVDRTRATLRQSTQFWQRPWEWLTGGLLMSAYTSLHAAEANRILLLGSDQLAPLLPVIRQRAVKYLPADDPRLEAIQSLPDPTVPAHQALARVQGKLVQAVTTAHAAAMGQPPPAGHPANASAAPDPDLLALTPMLGRDQEIAAMAMAEATHAEDQQQSEVRRFRGVLLGTFAGLIIVVALLAILGSVHPGYFPLCVRSQGAGGTTVTTCPTGGKSPGQADLAFIMAIGGIGAVLAVATSLVGLKPTGVRYSLSVVQGLVKIPFGAITAMLGIIILSTQSNIGVLATHAGLISTAVVFGYSQQLFTKLIDKRADDLLNQASGK